jgi:FkbM family methyltransferase
MNFLLKNGLRSLLSTQSINTVRFGKNKGLRLRYSKDLNLDMLLGFHEPNTFRVFDIFVRPGMVVADIGANVGYFSAFLSKKAGNNGSVHAFEPIPTTFEVLKDTLNLNGLSNVAPVNKAVSDSDGTVTMFLSHTHYMASIDSQWAGSDGGETKVASTTLDSYFKQTGKFPDFIKMDIEGGGVSALKGMLHCITKNEPVLFLESHTGAEDAAIGAALQLAEYEVHRVGSDVPVKYLDKDYNDKYGIYGTVIGIPKSRINEFGAWKPSSFQQRLIGQRA